VVEENSTSWPFCLLDAAGPEIMGLSALVFPGLPRVAYHRAFLPGIVRESLNTLLPSVGPSWWAGTVTQHDPLDGESMRGVYLAGTSLEGEVAPTGL
jgi:hypothetical protein